MKCPACGTWYPDQKLFCLSCGDLLSSKDGKVRLGEYVLLEKIGQGGVGVVYRARHEGINQEVAIKLLNQSSFGDTQHMQRFKRETRLHEKLEHPNIIHLIDVLEEGEVMALVMELLRGCSLKEYVIHRGELPLGEIIYVAQAVLSALQVAHQQDIIHRDLKPSNIFLTDAGDVRLMDFGLAKSTTSNEDITASGITVGTYLYMAPEQILGKEIGAFTDLYAFGIVLYRMATGILPFMSTGGGEFEIMEKQVRHQAEHPKKLNPNIPDALDDLIMDLLHKTPQQRPKDCAEVMSRIEALGEPERVSIDLADMQSEGSSVSTLSDLNQIVMEQEESTLAEIEAQEESITDTISYNTLLGTFFIESPAAPESPPFDMRHPPALSRDTLAHLRKSIAKIPPLPEVWYQVQVIFDDIESSPADLAKVIAQDAVLTVSILEICNSAAYLPVGAKPVTDVALALARVGMGGAEALILGEIIPEFGGI
ncbi:MAG: protein kinase, partial [Ghiorsea sp.]|nr:protein kinase [Ghiorsea sp.]